MPEAEVRGIWQDEDVAVVARGARLPRRCFQCNAPADRKASLLLKWSPPTGMRRSAARAFMEKMQEEQITVTVYACPSHYRRMNFHRRFGLALILFGLGCLLGAAVLDLRQVYTGVAGPLALAGLGAIIAGWLWRLIAASPLEAGHIDEQEAMVTGFGLPFLQSLPSWREEHAARTEQTASRLEHLTE